MVDRRFGDVSKSEEEKAQIRKELKTNLKTGSSSNAGVLAWS